MLVQAAHGGADAEARLGQVEPLRRPERIRDVAHELQREGQVEVAVVVVWPPVVHAHQPLEPGRAADEGQVESRAVDHALVVAVRLALPGEDVGDHARRRRTLRHEPRLELPQVARGGSAGEGEGGATVGEDPDRRILRGGEVEVDEPEGGREARVLTHVAVPVVHPGGRGGIVGDEDLGRAGLAVAAHREGVLHFEGRAAARRREVQRGLAGGGQGDGEGACRRPARRREVLLEDGGGLEGTEGGLVLGQHRRIRSPPQLRPDRDLQPVQAELAGELHPDRRDTVVDIDVGSVVGLLVQPEEVALIAPVVVSGAVEALKVEPHVVP